MTISVTVLQPLKIMTVAQNAEDCENGFMDFVSDNYRAFTPTSVGLNRSATFTPLLGPLMTNVLFSPEVATAHATLR